MRSPVLCALLAGVLAIGQMVSAAMARPLVPAEKREKPFDAVLPFCDDLGVLRDIMQRFHDRETEYWRSGLEITAYGRITEIGYRTNGLDYIPRRYCVARVVMNDQRERTISYQMRDSEGPIGYGFGIEFCIEGLDRNYADAPACKQAQP